MMRIAAGEDDYKAAIRKIMKNLMEKQIQILYSGCGKKTNKPSKLNFSETKSYNILKTVIGEYFEKSDDLVRTRVSKWFSGVCDRDGGRTERARQTKSNQNQEVDKENL
ncbi:hypothetical protein TKK_0018295 [Trichogramma kaykai]